MIAFTAYSYGRMVKVYPSSGSAYTYTQQSISSHLGFLVGWTVMMDYLFLPMLNVYVTSVFMYSVIPAVPFGIWIGLFIIPVTIISIRGIKISANFNTLFILLQVVFIIVFICLSVYQVLTHQMGVGFSLKPFYNSSLTFSPVFQGASIVATSFLGFDAVTTFTEETKNPKKTVPRAIFLVAVLGGIFFLLITYTMTSVFPDFTAYNDVDAAGAEIISAFGSTFLTSLFIATLITGNVGGILAAQSSGARLLYAMGRDAVLPAKVFGHLHSKYKTPVFNIIIVAIICLGAFFIDSDLGFSLVNFGALFAFTFVNLSVVFHFYIKNKQRNLKGTISYLIIPQIGAGLTFWIWVNLSKEALIAGGIWASIGIVYLLMLTKGFTQKPPQYKFKD
ncbi:APC family permease [Virgibacillus dakarensis]|uniref:APC family permease n=1 Tax=Virgibacillus dakarensis TaxID=1917889 RepID=UPI001F1A48EB|nr:APC family permease [Virgibacillus dakarensis]